MRKSLIVIASALILAVAAATHDRLRYDSTVFTDVRITGAGQRSAQVEYPPCVRGVREDRCIQLYERGVRRSYQRWLAERGRGQQLASAPRAGQRAYRACRGRGDDRCRQVASVRRARATRPARTHYVQRRAAVRRAHAARPAQPARVTRAAVRQPVRAAPRPVVHRTRPGVQRPHATHPRATGTPGI